MRPLRSVTGSVAILDRPDVDTDQIIPKQFLKRIERSGYGAFLFYDWMKDPGFALHRHPDATILMAGRNFGCGSSREHAAWALDDYGFRIVIAPSFGDIFRTNAIKTGLAPIVVAADEIAMLRAALNERDELTVDLEELTIVHPDGLAITFDLDAYVQETLVHGLDDLARTLLRADAIAGFEEDHPARFDARALAV